MHVYNWLVGFLYAIPCRLSWRLLIRLKQELSSVNYFFFRLMSLVQRFVHWELMLYNHKKSYDNKWRLWSQKYFFFCFLNFYFLNMTQWSITRVKILPSLHEVTTRHPQIITTSNFEKKFSLHKTRWQISFGNDFLKSFFDVLFSPEDPKLCKNINRKSSPILAVWLQ